jgi:HEAT repeats
MTGDDGAMGAGSCDCESSGCHSAWLLRSGWPAWSRAGGPASAREPPTTDLARASGREIRHWEPVIVRSDRRGDWTLWSRREPTLLRSWFFKTEVEDGDKKMSLLDGDPAAVPVLIELLGSRNAKARQIAAQGLEKVGDEARCAVPALLVAIDDPQEEVRRYAEQALMQIDREAGERAGLEYTMWGVHRRERRAANEPEKKAGE